MGCLGGIGLVINKCSLQKAIIVIGVTISSITDVSRWRFHLMPPLITRFASILSGIFA